MTSQKLYTEIQERPLLISAMHGNACILDIFRSHMLVRSRRAAAVCMGTAVARTTVEERVCARAFRITHVISIFSASQLHFLANRSSELTGGSQ